MNLNGLRKKVVKFNAPGCKVKSYANEGDDDDFERVTCEVVLKVAKSDFKVMIK